MTDPGKAEREGGEEMYIAEKETAACLQKADGSKEPHQFIQAPNPFVSFCVKCGLKVDWYKVRVGQEAIPQCLSEAPFREQN